MLAITAFAVGYKSLWSSWSWLDIIIISLFFLLRGLIEWVIHSLLYHANPIPLLGWRLESNTHKQHIEHHLNPLDLSRLLITFRGVFSLSVLVFGFSSLLFQSINIAATMMLGFVVVGIIIEVIHLICHCDIPHRSKAMQRIVWLHRHHHQNNGKSHFGVSSSLGDRLFGSYPDTNGNSKS